MWFQERKYIDKIVVHVYMLEIIKGCSARNIN